MSAEILALTAEAAIRTRYGKISFANDSAKKILGADCIGKSVKTVFGPEIAGSQAAQFIASISIKKENYVLKVSRTTDNQQVIFFSRPEYPAAMFSEPCLYAMRNSLMNINLAAERLRIRAEELGEAELLSDLTMLTRNYYRLQRVIQNASLIKNLAEGNLFFGTSSVNLSQLCASVFENISALFRRAEFKLDIDPDIIMQADPGFIRLLLLNLISNCLVHAEGCENIHFVLKNGTDFVSMSITNDGKGISTEMLPAVFDSRMSPDMGKFCAGAGFGLTAARSIVDFHDGSILLESHIERGSTVRISLKKKRSGSVTLHTPELDEKQYIRDVLVGLSDCLPDSCYTENYMD